MTMKTSGISDLKTIYTFPVLWEGWETDNVGYIAQDIKGNKYLLLTNHGNKYIAKKSELLDKIDEYKQTLAKSEVALQMLEN